MRTKPVPTLAEVRKWPATVGVPDAARALGINKAHLYELVKRGEAPVRVLPLGSRQRVITASLVAVLEGA
ncbi:DNA-binding protein [Streptomyces sp. NPDC059909]|uniref:DNA-binding protein n=1 Tax=Streptomyces sp. NPDC059909 TaxID=3346998 RepID=UPI003649AA7D